MSNIVIYNDGELELDVSLNAETIWLTQKQLCELFGRDKSVISRHIRNIFKDNELDKNSTVAKNATVQKEGDREIVREIEFYNLDMIISVGYRVNSLKATKFRQWATKILKNYIVNGYSINSEKITNERFVSLENDVNFLKTKINNISNHIEDRTMQIKQGVFYDGEIFDAYAFISSLIKNAKKEIILVDNYIDESTLTLFSKNKNIKLTIYTKNLSKELKLDIQKYNKQYNNLEVKICKNFHDRFLIIDENDIYHIGASLKDLGTKVFAFSKMQIDTKIFLQQL